MKKLGQCSPEVRERAVRLVVAVAGTAHSDLFAVPVLNRDVDSVTRYPSHFAITGFRW
jgi:hypothetical protein